jgi:CheY-like chemotaxis protein
MNVSEDTERRLPAGLALSGGRILVVIRDAALRRLVSLRLAFRGAEVCPVSSVAEALEVFAGYAPNTVLAETDLRARSLAEVFEDRLAAPVYAATLGSDWVDA